MLDPHGKTSHFIWRDPSHILAWAWHPSHGDKFYLYEDRTDRVEVVAPDVMTENGHCSYLPGGRMDPQRHVPGPAAGAARLPLRHRDGEEAPARPLPLAAGVRRRVALRHASPRLLCLGIPAIDPAASEQVRLVCASMHTAGIVEHFADFDAAAAKFVPGASMSRRSGTILWPSRVRPR